MGIGRNDQVAYWIIELLVIDPFRSILKLYKCAKLVKFMALGMKISLNQQGT